MFRIFRSQSSLIPNTAFFRQLSTFAEPVLFKPDRSGDKSLRALFLTTNSYKIGEYTAALTGTYGVRVSSHPLPADMSKSRARPVHHIEPVDDSNHAGIRKILAEADPTPNFVIHENSQLVDAITHQPLPDKLTAEHHMRPVMNSAFLKVWKPAWNPDGTLKQITFQQYSHSIKGYLDRERATSFREQRFGWDADFVNSATGRTHAEDASRWGKISARQLVLDDLITGYLLYRTPKDLKNFPLSPSQAVDFDIAVEDFINHNRYFTNEHMADWRMQNVLQHQLNRGLFFKAASSRPVGNYFSPPFSGLPLTPKKTGPEETVYSMHDINHHNIPDLIFDGTHSVAHKQVYAAWRMMSEAITMIMADMFYADSLVKSGVDASQVDTRIYPLFTALNLPPVTDANRTALMKQLLRANVSYAILGDDSLWRAMLKPGQEDKLEAFKNHFSKFFIGDHAWTHANYENMAKMRDHYRTWVRLVGRTQFERADATLLSDMVDRIHKRGCDFNDFSRVVDSVFDEIFTTRILPAIEPAEPLSRETRQSNAFFRYMLGQTSFYAKYKNMPGVIERGEAMMKRLLSVTHFSPELRRVIRDQFKQDVYHVWGHRVITTAMVANICQVHPVFPPVYISYARPLYPSIQEAMTTFYGKTAIQQLTAELAKEEKYATSSYVREINGITFIDALALENSVDIRIPAKDRLRQKMINAGVEFWDDEKTIVKTPVIGVSMIGSYAVSLEGDLPPGMICLYMGNARLGPMTPETLANGLRDTMGVQSFHTNMNPRGKTARELYDVTVGLGHFSITHSAYLGIYALGISKKAELEFDVKRDLIHLARETSARAAAQDEPVLFALSREGAEVSKTIRQQTSTALTAFRQKGSTLDWREERNALYPLSAVVSLGMNGTIRNLSKVVADRHESGKELEYRIVLQLLYQSLNGLLPEIFKPAPNEQPKPLKASAVVPAVIAGLLLFTANRNKQPKHAIILLGAPGVGKSMQTGLLMQHVTGVMCVSTGNLVRKLNKKLADKLPLTAVEAHAAESLELMRQGKLMDDKAVYALLMAHLSPGGEGYEEYQRCHTIILDGVLKAEANIKPFEAAFNEFNASGSVPMNLKRVINITASTDELIARQESRVAETKAAGLPQRPDDDVTVYRRRLQDYMQSTQGIVDYYQEQGCLVVVNSSHVIHETTALLVTAIQDGNPHLRLER